MKQFFKKVFSKEFWVNVMECLKYFTMVFFMTAGLWLVLSMLWHAVGLPLEDWSMWVTFVLACLCERLWLWWVSNT